MIDLVRQRRVQIAQRIVGERRQMDDGIEAAQIRDLEGADVLAEGRDRLAPGTERRAAIEVSVDAGHLVPGLLQKRRHDGADVTATAGEENSHVVFAPLITLPPTSTSAKTRPTAVMPREHRRRVNPFDASSR